MTKKLMKEIVSKIKNMVDTELTDADKEEMHGESLGAMYAIDLAYEKHPEWTDQLDNLSEEQIDNICDYVMDKFPELYEL